MKVLIQVTNVKCRKVSRDQLSLIDHTARETRVIVHAVTSAQSVTTQLISPNHYEKYHLSRRPDEELSIQPSSSCEYSEPIV